MGEAKNAFSESLFYVSLPRAPYQVLCPEFGS